jgi:hypothetical protein
MVGRSETDKIVATQRSKLQLLCDCISSFGHKACGGHLAFFDYGNRSKLQESRFYEDLVNGQNSQKAYVVSGVKRHVTTKLANFFFARAEKFEYSNLPVLTVHTCQ